MPNLFDCGIVLSYQIINGVALRVESNNNNNNNRNYLMFDISSLDLVFF